MNLAEARLRSSPDVDREGAERISQSTAVPGANRLAQVLRGRYVVEPVGRDSALGVVRPSMLHNPDDADNCQAKQ